MQRTSFMLGVTLLVVAATLAYTITVRKTETGPSGSEERASVPSHAVVGSSRDPSPPSSRPRSDAWLQRTGGPERFSVTAPEGHPDEARLSGQAAKVQTEAQSELKRLTTRLELTSEQRRRLFPILVRTSKHYDPALQISGSPSGAPALPGAAGNREVNQVLKPGQQDQLIEESLADLALWQEIVDKLRRRLDEETPDLAPAVPTSPEPPTRDRSNLFERIAPNP